MRLLHTMLRVGNLQRSIDFYTKVMGMTLLKTTENTEYNIHWLLWVMAATPIMQSSNSPSTGV